MKSASISNSTIRAPAPITNRALCVGDRLKTEKTIERRKAVFASPTRNAQANNHEPAPRFSSSICSTRYTENRLARTSTLDTTASLGGVASTSLSASDAICSIDESPFLTYGCCGEAVPRLFRGQSRPRQAGETVQRGELLSTWLGFLFEHADLYNGLLQPVNLIIINPPAQCSLNAFRGNARVLLALVLASGEAEAN